MSAPTNGYTVRLVYYGRADLKKKTKGGYYSGENERSYVSPTYEPVSPQIGTQNIRIVPFAYDSESFPEVAIYEIVKNAEAPKSDLEGTKI